MCHVLSETVTEVEFNEFKEQLAVRGFALPTLRGLATKMGHLRAAESFLSKQQPTVQPAIPVVVAVPRAVSVPTLRGGRHVLLVIDTNVLMHELEFLRSLLRGDFIDVIPRLQVSVNLIQGLTAHSSKTHNLIPLISWFYVTITTLFIRVLFPAISV